MQTISYQPELSPALRVVVGNVDYSEFKETLERIDQILKVSGIEADFVRMRMEEYEKETVIYARQMGKKEVLPGGVEQFIHMLTGKIGAVHFIDSDGTLHDNETSTHAPFGKGVLDFKAITKAFLDAGYTDEWWPIDLCFWSNALEATEPTKKFMDKLVAKYGQT